MTFSEFVQSKIGKSGQTKTAFIKEFSKDCGVSCHTLLQVCRGVRLNRFDKAKAISTATDGVVTVLELCE